MSTWEESHLKESVCFFKKHRGEPWWDVIQEDRAYVEWVLENLEIDEELHDALTWGVKHAPERM